MLALVAACDRSALEPTTPADLAPGPVDLAVAERADGDAGSPDLSMPPPAAAWPTLGHDPQHRGRSELVLPSHAPSLRWQVPVGVTLLQPIVGATGTIYAVSDAIYSFRPADGRLLWRYPLGDVAAAPPTLSLDGAVVSGGLQRGALLAVDAASGMRRWELSACASV